jgi:hypothetical protein
VNQNENQLGITDPTFKTVANYGTPSQNWGSMTSDYLMNGEWSPMQQWEMWMRKPEPQVVIIDLKISDFLNGLLELLTAPSVATPLSKLLRSEKDE